MFCVQCGKENPEGARYCAACGKAVARVADTITALLAAGGAPQSEGMRPPDRADVTAGKACPACGRLNPNIADRCGCGASFISGVVSPIAPSYAGFWIRVAASVLDGFVIGVLAVLGALILGVAGMVSGEPAEFAAVGYYIVAILASWLYYAILESSSKQATLGKRAVGIMVTDLSGKPLSFGRASGRAFAKWLNILTLHIGWLVVAFTRQKRGIHDFLAGTVVVKRDPSRKAGPIVLVTLGLLAAIPIIGIIAAIAIPGLLRARISGNEASAIGSLRAISAAQQTYATRCSGFAPALPSLNLGGQIIAAELAASTTVVRSGYQFTVSPASGAQLVESSAPGCDGAVSLYVARAIPVTPYTTGIRFFALTADGTIYVDDNQDFTNPRPLQ